MTEQNCHVAEFTVEWTPSGKLNAHGGIFLHSDQIPGGDRSVVKIAETGTPVDPIGAPFFQVLQKKRQREFGLVENKMIHLPEFLRFSCKERSARDHFQAILPAASDDLFR